MTMKTKDDVHEFENLEKKEWDGLVAFLQEQGVKSRPGHGQPRTPESAGRWLGY